MRLHTTILLLAAVTSSLAQAADCQRGEALYKEGLNAGKNGDMRMAVDKLQQSLAVCNSYESAYLLGQAQQSLGNQAAAEQAFEQARQMAANNDALALALARYAETRRDQQDIVEALAVVQEARSLHSEPPQWVNNLALELDSRMADQPLQVAQVTRALTLPKRAFHIVDKPPGGGSAIGAGGNSGAGVPTVSANPYANNPSINVRINFDYNSTSVDYHSQANIRVLAEALNQPSFVDKSFVLVGHTDVRGEWGYNQQLSQERALAVQSRLISLSPALRGRLITEGAGEGRPLYRGTSEREHRLNRRLEVVVRS